MKSKKYYSSKNNNCVKFKKSKKRELEYIIIAYIIAVYGMSYQERDEYLIKINDFLNSKENTQFGNLRIKNIILPNRENTNSDVKLIFPTVSGFESSILNDYLSETKKRKLKIFKFLNDEIIN
jgi:hypothetical protein